MKYLLLCLFLQGCWATAEKRGSKDPPGKISISGKRIRFAYSVCRDNKKGKDTIKEIQVKPVEQVVCANGAIFKE